MILTLNNISKSFDGVKALRNCSFSLKEKQITALIGPNGSGKSTAFHVISRLYVEDKGKIMFKGKSLKTTKDFDLAKSGVSRTFQQVRLFKNLSIKEHFHLLLDKENESLTKSFLHKKQTHNKTIKYYLDKVGLDKPTTTLVTDLSYGQRKLLDLALALAKPHDLLMLDEPVAGVNPRLRTQIKAILRKLRKQGETILVIEHDMNFVMDLADEIFVLDQGTIIAQGTPEKIQSNRRVLDAYLGE